MDALVEILIPLGICVVLPVMALWIIFRAQSNKDNKNAEIIIAAIEKNSAIDADKIVKALGKKEPDPVRTLQRRLLLGCIFTFLGIGCFIFSAVALNYGKSFSNQLPIIFFATCSFTVGLAFLTVYFVSRKTLKNKEIECEDDTQEIH